MSVGLVGRKVGMTRVFKADGVSIPVTVLQVKPNRITQIKTLDRDGYLAIQVTMGNVKQQRVNQPMKGHFEKAGTEPGEGCWEFRLDDISQFALGGELNVSLFAEGQYVDVTGTSKGKGFAGAIKRHHFRSQDMTHGNSLSHRAIGSTGQNQTPGRVFKGKKMSGHLGDVRRTSQNLQIVMVNQEQNLLLVKGVVPGAPSGIVIIRSAVKKAERGE